MITDDPMFAEPVVGTAAPPGALLWPGEQADFTEEDLDALLVWASDQGASDIRLETGKQVIVQRHGRVHRATRRPLTIYEVERATNRVYAADGVARLRNAKDFNVAYETEPERGRRYRFRVNASGALVRGVDGAALVARALPTTPRPLETQNVEPMIEEWFKPNNGMVIVAGSTGSGKSTLLSGFILRKLQDPDSHRAIGEYSEPIEYVFDGCGGPTSEITQIEIGRHLETFADGVRHAVRSNFDDIVVGECRDAATMTAAIDAAQANHAVYLTVHAGSIYETFQRMVSLCPAAVRDEMTITLAQAVRLVVNQRLIWSADGTRTPIREWMVCDRETRRMLGGTPPKSWPIIMENQAKALKCSYSHSIHRALDETRITEAVALKHLKELEA